MKDLKSSHYIQFQAKLFLTALCLFATIFSCLGQTSPISIKVNDCSAGKDLGEIGVYTQSPINEESSCGCWNQVDGTRSLGRYLDQWVIFFKPNCTNLKDIHPISQKIAGCDPTVEACVDGLSINVGNCLRKEGIPEEGIYVLSAKKGSSDCGCYNQLNGSYSLGKVNGIWYSFAVPDCNVGYPGINQISKTEGCNPTDLTCVSWSCQF